ncbi:MAG: GGDEF domain-containing protein [Eubacterium sp.]|nr:GGDEF domain-containing protein [Eubacterium sp.]
MNNNNRPNIGFFTCHLDNDYAFEICKGVEYAAEEADVNLTIFPGMYLNAFYNDPDNAKYDYQYNSIFYYANKNSLDALIISIGSIGSFLSTEDKKSFLESFDIPILTIEAEIPGYPYLYTEGVTGMKGVVEHLIRDHGCTEIGFVSGRLENADALERFNVYKAVLEENNIPYDEKKVAYGNFSEFTEDIVTELLDNNPDIQAIVFANDTMAIGGYNAIRKKGLVIGRDIFVTGYDNTSTSLSLSPPLTTVDTRIMDLGYNAIYQAIELIENGTTTKTLLHSHLVKRLSCGCNPFNDQSMFMDLSEDLKSYNSETLVEKFKELFMQPYFNSFYSKQLFSALDDYFKLYTDIIYEDSGITSDDLIAATEEIMANDIIQYYFTHNKMIYLLNIFSNFLLNLKFEEEIHDKLQAIFNTILSFLSFYMSNDNVMEIKRNKANVWQAMRLTRDTLITAYDDEKCFSLIAENLSSYSGFRSAYVYLYEEVPALLMDGSWSVPKHVLLQTYCKDGKSTYLSGTERYMPSNMLFNNSYTPNERRHTMVLTPLFTNEKQHGLLLCETDYSTFSMVYPSSLQLGTSLEFLSLIKQEMATQARLEQSMKEIRDKNDQLNAISVTDELTGLYNRRGFFEVVNQLLSDKSHFGDEGLVGYIDMDNLKQVNDLFGHKEGDFSLMTIADILRKSFPRGTIIARIGGDEYAVFVPDMTGTKMMNILNSLRDYHKRVNDQSTKPYYIDFSYGFKELAIRNDLDLEGMMAEADTILYSNKKNKRKNVRKDA